MSPLAGALLIDTALTAGAVAVLPDTLWPDASATAWAPSPKPAAAPAPLRIVAPFSVSALAPIETPSASASAACTT